MGGLHRLSGIGDELDEAAGHRQLDTALRRVQLHVEGFMNRAYELRDRAIHLTQRLFPREKKVGAMKKPADRPARIAVLALTDRDYASALDAFLGTLDHDMLIRNQHTHQFYVSFRLCTDTDDFEPLDAWGEVKMDPHYAPVFGRHLRTSLREVVGEYGGRIRRVHDGGLRLAEAADRVIRGT